jgi:hypothetical protein
MKMTARALRAREDKILGALEHSPGDNTFRGRLYRDGVPTPASCLKQRVRVLFVFREPNMRGKPYALDMRDQVRDEKFRPCIAGEREDRSNRGWWNDKVGLFAHAAASALDGEPEPASFKRFQSVMADGKWNHEVVNRFAYIQIKKVGGGGTSDASKICEHAERYAQTLKDQISLYRPHIVIGCGLGRSSPANLLHEHVFVKEGASRKARTGAMWWQWSAASRPQALLREYHPSVRNVPRADVYRDVWSSVREIANKVRMSR